jgi:prolyl-tRNA synthetase
MDNRLIEINANKQSQFSEWYNQVVFRTGMLDYYDITGCYVMLPYSYKMWELIKEKLDEKFCELGVQNVSFPLLITKHNLERESSHIDGFKPEVVWVNRHEEQIDDNAKDNDTDMLAIRPTSECAFYPTFAKNIRTHADMPILWNQWCNVMRWEVSSTTPFIRHRDFLWQEGHCAFNTKDQVDTNIKQILDIYKHVYNNVLAVPIIVGKKIPSEKFAGASNTFCIETFIPCANKAIQCATAHDLEQNFSKMFNVQFQTEEGHNEYAYQTSWGFTIRSIGATIMTHGDNYGLVLPPTVAPIQIVIVPITFAKSNKNYNLNDKIIERCMQIKFVLTTHHMRVHVDLTDKTPGKKYYLWEAKGVPMRIEIGPRDLQNNTMRIVCRHDKGLPHEKCDVNIDDVENIWEPISSQLKLININMLIKAEKKLAECVSYATSLDEIKQFCPKFTYCIMCNNPLCEQNIRDLDIKPICIPYECGIVDDTMLCTQCVSCGEPYNDTMYKVLLAKTF